MPIYLLDTNICIYIARHNPSEVRARFQQHVVSELAMSVITLGELRFGAEKSREREGALSKVERLADLIQTLAMTEQVGLHYGQIRADLEKSGTPIGNNDLWIAAHARAEGLILVTNNEREFLRVSGLRVENWVKSPDD